VAGHVFNSKNQGLQDYREAV